MKRIIYIILFGIIIFLILLNSYEIMENIRFSFSLCVNNLFPSLIPFMLLSNILIKYNFVNDISSLLECLMIKIFKINKNCSFALIMSILSGSPSNAKYIKDLFDNNLISIVDVKKCLNFCHFTNPVFIIGTIGYTFLKNKKIGLIILFSHYISSLIIGLFNKKSNNTNLKVINNKSKKTNFINILKQSITDTTNTLFLILGIITTSIIFTCIIDNVFNLNTDLKFIYGFIEITQGLKYLSLSNFNIELKAIISSFMISFGGFCIHAQVFSILDNKKIRYYPYLIFRIFHGIISAFLTLFFIKSFN